MSVSFKIVNEGKGILVFGESTVSSAELMSATRKQFERDENVLNLRYIISDYTKVEKVILTKDDIGFLASKYAKAAKINSQVACAFIGKSKILSAMMRMWEDLSAAIPWETRAFDTEVEARYWIDRKMEQRHGRFPISQPLQSVAMTEIKYMETDRFVAIGEDSRKYTIIDYAVLTCGREEEEAEREYWTTSGESVNETFDGYEIDTMFGRVSAKRFP